MVLYLSSLFFGEEVDWENIVNVWLCDGSLTGKCCAVQGQSCDSCALALENYSWRPPLCPDFDRLIASSLQFSMDTFHKLYLTKCIHDKPWECSSVTLFGSTPSIRNVVFVQNQMYIKTCNEGVCGVTMKPLCDVQALLIWNLSSNLEWVLLCKWHSTFGMRVLIRK